MKFGLKPLEYNYIQETVIAPLAALNLKVFCFGSRARGTHSKFSDLDLMIEGTKTKNAEILKSKIEEVLSNGNFPLKVDLVFIDDFAQSYKDNYLNERKPWT